MSKFLGPIHFWLYNKIGNQEKLTAEMAGYAKEKGWIEDEAPYIKELPPLELVIDEGNIHGWLQSQIGDAETRYARLLKTVLAGEEDRVEDLCALAYDFGQRNPADGKANAGGVYKYFEDFFVNGMPCDGVNRIIDETSDQLEWEMTRDIHEQYWEGGDDRTYYYIRKAVMDGMVEKTSFKVEMMDFFHYGILRK